MHSRPNAVAVLLVCIVQKNCTFHSDLGKLSSLGRGHLFFCSALSPRGAPQKSGGYIKISIFFRLTLDLGILLLPVSLSVTLHGDHTGEQYWIQSWQWVTFYEPWPTWPISQL